ncbi:MAG: FHA domain-containing protein [Polyangiaceae bacterium]
MPLTIVVRSTGEDSPSLTFDGSRVVIGRGDGCDVRLPDPSVSHRHAIIRIEAGEHALIDEGSANGTFVGGVRLSPRTPRIVKTGDLVRVGRVWLELRIDQTPPTRDLAMATRDLALALVGQAMRALGDDTTPKVRVVEGRDVGATLALAEEGRLYVAGRDDTCDLPIEDSDASREHVRFVRRGTSILVRDAGSKNGAFLGETRISHDRDTAWRPALMLRIDRTVLTLDEPVALALSDIEQGGDEAIAEEDLPPPPVAPAPAPAEEAPRSEARPATAAPIAQVDGGRSSIAPRRKKKSGWSGTDLAVVVAALAVIALSVAGLVWLLRT